MSVLTKPTNPHNNTSPNILRQENYADPIALATAIASKEGLPESVLDRIYTDCASLAKDSWLGFLDMFQMNMAFTTDYVQLVETTSPDYVIDDDGAVTRVANVFTIDWTAVEGYEVGEDPFFFRENFVITVVDDNGVIEQGVITAVDKANDQFTAVCRNGANWSVDTSNLTIDAEAGGDFDKGSCGPEGLMELRKRKSTILKLMTIKDAMEAKGGERYRFCLDGTEDGEVMWYDDNTVELMKRLNKKVAKALMNDIESVDGSGADSAGKYGTMGLFQNLKQNGLVSTGYISTIAHIEAITTYWDSLGFEQGKEFIAHVDRQQYRYFESLAVDIATDMGVEVHIVLGNTPDNYMKFGFNSLRKDGYIIHFSKWGLTDGNSPLGKKRISDVMPKGIIMPMGTVKTKINGVEKSVPYIFKCYQDFAGLGVNSAGMIRTFLTGGFNGDGDCEYSKITKSTTVGIACVCPEAVTIIV